MNAFDLIIIGAGPGGYEAAAIGAGKGLKTLLIERGELGGTCLNRGCIPTKCLCRSAEVIESARQAAEFGIAIDDSPQADIPAIIGRKNRVVAELREGVALAVAKAQVINGEAGFTAPNVVKVNGEEFTAPKIIIATGSVPARLPIPGVELAADSDALLEIESLPPRLAIIGGGVIGLEFASVFEAFGSEVTVVEYCKEVLPPFDREVAKRLRMALQKRGIAFHTSAEVTSLRQTEGGIELKFTKKGKEETVEADAVLMAVGRRPALPAGLEAAGIAATPRRITVNNSFETSVPGVFAIGDCNGRCLLAHAASAQARAVMGERVNLSVIPSAVFTMPEAAMAGPTEEQLKEQGVEFKTTKALFRANGKAAALGEPDGLLKLITAPDGRILACHVCGPHAADIAAEASLAIANNLTAADIAATVHAHPTLSEVLAAAAASSEK